MRTCIVGAGAIGGLIGADLALAGEEVAFVDIGKQLDAIRRNGITILSAEGEERVARDLRATDRFEEVGEQDLVILAVKANVIRDVVQEMRVLYGPDTVVLTVQNGLPWWYFQGLDGRWADWRLDSLDTEGEIAKNVEADRIVGCIAYPAATLDRPGVIRHLHGHSFPVGEPRGGETKRIGEISALLQKAGYKSRVLDDVRSELWLKLVGVLAFNPISALTHSTMAEICEDVDARTLVMELMGEAESVAAALGVTLRVPLERRLSGAERVGHHRTSMLQDVEAGNALEVEALLGCVIELGKKLEVPTPRIESLYTYTRLLDGTLARTGRGIGPLTEGSED